MKTTIPWMKKTVAGLSLLTALVTPRAAGAPADSVAMVQPSKAERMQWWREARFGMFIHWGLYSLPAGTWQGKRVPGLGEWIMCKGRIPVAEYSKLAAQFNPVGFNAAEWVRIAKRAGMKYIIITSKHHDGFAMFKTAASKFNIVDATPFGRDPLQELAKACREQGIKLGFYYSQAQDWHNRGGASMEGHWDPAAQDGDMDEYLTRIAIPQVRELLSNYGPVGVFWWDTPTDMTPARADRLAPLLNLQPNVVTNNRLGGGYLGDTETPENRVPATGYSRDWEACMTMNDTWGFKDYDENWKSAEELIRSLIDIASKGGNFLLNVGPTAQGEFPAPSQERLRAIGEWMSRNSEAIHGSTASPFTRLTWGRVTQKPGRLFLHVFAWPDDGRLVVPMRNGIDRGYLLAQPETPLEFQSTPDGIVVKLPPTAPDPVASVVVLETSVPVDPLPPPPLKPDANGTLVLECDAASLVGEGLRVYGNTELELVEWSSNEMYPRWDAEFVQSGRYEISALCSVPKGEAGDTYTVEIGAKRLAGTTRFEGDGFRWQTLGIITLQQPGRAPVSLKPTTIAGQEFMRLRTLRIKRLD